MIVNHLLPIEQVNSELRSVDFELKTRAQLVKDFATQGLYFHPGFESSTGDFEAIIAEIASLIVELMKRGERYLLQLLYTIDLPERYFLEIVQESNMPQILATYILRREAYKVYLRKQFS